MNAGACAEIREVAGLQLKTSTSMALWRLFPIDLSDPSWEASSHRGPAIVRARDEATAREVAQAAFGVKTAFRARPGMVFPPWKRKELVGAERIEDESFDANGPSEVHSPSFGSDLRRKPQ
jgi:hypothetical protein